MKKKLALLVAIVAIAAVVIYKYAQPKQPGFGAFRDYNVLLVTIDTLRADHLPVYGNTRVQTPSIDRLAAKSLIFEDAVAHTPMTLSSHASILTGLLPMAHGIRDNAGYILDTRITTLAEILKNNGYNTAAFVSAFVLDSQFGLDQGFDLYSDSFTLAQPRVNNTDTQRRAEETQAEVNVWLKHGRNTKFFLWVHYYDPHDPYQPPEPYRTQYAASSYDGEIAYTDHVLGRLISAIDSVKEKTIIVVAGDHGESLGEHKEQTHSIFIYNATQHVPLLIRLPNGKEKRVPGIAGLIDIAPSVLEWLGIQPDPAMQGKSLIPLVQEREKVKRAAYSESLFSELHYGWSPLRSLTTEEYKFIDAPTPELYDRKKDPREISNLMSVNPDKGNILRKQLLQLVESHSRGELKVPVQMDPETEAKLRALGYVGTVVRSTSESRTVDPKDKIDLLETISKARRAMDNKDYSTALKTAEEALAQDPRMVDAHFIAATSNLHLGQKEKALAEMMETIRLKPDHTQTLYNLAFFHQLKSDHVTAEYWYLQLLKYEPEHLVGSLNLVGLYRQTNQPQKAQERLSKVLHLYGEAARITHSPENRSKLLETMSEIYFKIGDHKQSEALIKQAIQLTPSRAVLHFHMGVIYETQKKPDAARDQYKEALRLLEGIKLDAEQRKLRETILNRM